MMDEEKAREQLIDEVAGLRRRIAELEASELDNQLSVELITHS